jgi:hypothetical protein
MPYETAVLYYETGRAGIMARPTDRAEAKSEILNIRVTPTLKAKLEAEAKLSGSKLSAEVERRLVASMEKSDRASTPETRQLLDEIEETISQIEAGTGNRWSQGIGTWAAVAEMLARGPIMARAPSHVTERDEELAQVFSELVGGIQRRDMIREMLSVLAGSTALNWLTGIDAVGERIESSELPDDVKENAAALVAEYRELDRAIDEGFEKVDTILEPIAAAIEDGRSYYVTPPTSFVLRTALKRLADKQQWMPAIGGGWQPVSALLPSVSRPAKKTSLADLLRPSAAKRDDNALAAGQDTL